MTPTEEVGTPAYTASYRLYTGSGTVQPNIGRLAQGYASGEIDPGCAAEEIRKKESRY
jgi:hypothetical protein